MSSVVALEDTCRLGGHSMTDAANVHIRRDGKRFCRACQAEYRRRFFELSEGEVVAQLTDQQVARFWSSVQRGTDDECWPWTGSYNSGGYGRFGVGPPRYLAAHRVSYRLLVGPIPTGLSLDHLCRNPRCVNPAHLEPVTHRENVLRGVSPPAVNVLKERCPSGHIYDLINTYWSKRGGRACRTCQQEGGKRFRARRMERAS